MSVQPRLDPPRKERELFRRASAVTLSALALALLAACGSSAPAGKTSTTTGSEPVSSGIQVNTTPRYLKPSPSEPIRSGVVDVAYRDITIHPAVLRVRVGTLVKWTNYDAVDHNVTSEGGPQSFASDDFGQGGTFEVKLTKPGVIHYQCTIHPATMNGTIEVVR
jgi:plastocyanin